MFRKKVLGIILGGAMMIGSCSASCEDFVGWLDSQGISPPYSVSSISAIADIFSSDAVSELTSAGDKPAWQFIECYISQITKSNEEKVATLWFFKHYFSYFDEEVSSKCWSLIFDTLKKNPNNLDIARSILMTQWYVQDCDAVKSSANLLYKTILYDKVNTQDALSIFSKLAPLMKELGLGEYIPAGLIAGE